MRISFSTVDSNLVTNNGYGYAGHNIINSLKNLGHEVELNSPSFPIQLNFVQPVLYKTNPGQYQIGYTPWESTDVPDGWLEGFSKVDEVWTTSDACAEWYKNLGLENVRVYEHGVDSYWIPRKREVNGPLKFLHIGEPAPRKGGQIAFDAFRAAFKGSRDYHLTIKAIRHSTVRIFEPNYHGGPRSILGSPSDLPNVSVIFNDLSISQLVSLYYEHHVMVYPSWGEGFGLIPLQALATGMPTICTGAWAPYRRFLGELELNSQVWDSPWPQAHPGKMYKPDFDHLVELYRHTASNYDRLSVVALDQSDKVRSEYNWDSLTEKAFRHLQ